VSGATDRPRGERSRRTFRSFSSRNFRLFFAGQVVSASGTWMQRVGQAWLVLDITGSGAALGAVTAVQHFPILALSLWGGGLADRFDKRRLLIVTQSAAGLLALALFALTALDVVELWMVIVLALMLGGIDAVDRPARLTFVGETVKPADLVNAVSLNTVIMNAAKAIGPSIAGFLIASVGVAVTFLVNGLSFIAVVLTLVATRTVDLMRPDHVDGHEAPGLRSAVREIGRAPTLAATLVLMAVVGTVAYEWQVILPLFASNSFDGDARTFGLMFSAIGIGAVGGGLFVANTTGVTPAALLRWTAVFGVALVVTSTMPVLWSALVALVVVGAFSSVIRAQSATLVQLSARPRLRGRAMALLAMAFAGTTPIGGPLVGIGGETIGVRQTMAASGTVTVVATAVTARYLRRRIAADEEPVVELAEGERRVQLVQPFELDEP
jgi:predicted MFS family arabinose efflux permease